MNYLRAIMFSWIRMIAQHIPSSSIRKFLFQATDINIGKNTFINYELRIIDDYIQDLIFIGNDVAFAPNVTLCAVSYHNNKFIREQYKLYKKGKITIEDGAWIGTGAIILPGIKIGKCAVIGAGSVVTKDVQPYTIVAGVPAKKFDDLNNK